MNRCIALVPSLAAPELWMPCPMNALEGDRFCLQHRDALDGAVLGWHSAELVRQLSETVPKNCKHRRIKAKRVNSVQGTVRKAKS
jgi:hypothetical protein